MNQKFGGREMCFFCWSEPPEEPWFRSTDHCAPLTNSDACWGSQIGSAVCDGTLLLLFKFCSINSVHGWVQETLCCEFSLLKGRSNAAEIFTKWRCEMELIFDVYVIPSCAMSVRFPTAVSDGYSSLMSAEWARASSGFAIGSFFFDKPHAGFLSLCALCSLPLCNTL